MTDRTLNERRESLLLSMLVLMSWKPTDEGDDALIPSMQDLRRRQVAEADELMKALGGDTDAVQAAIDVAVHQAYIDALNGIDIPQG